MLGVITSSGCLNNVFSPVACTEDARLCPDGSSVARVLPECDFAPCPPCTEGDTINAECPDGTEYLSKSCDENGVWHDVAYIRNPCEEIPDYESNLGASCIEHSECITPMEYLVQSNCPYASACIDGTCKVICPLTYHDPNPEISKTYPFECVTESDCNCTERTNSLDCVCLDGSCVSVEAEFNDDYWRQDGIQLLQHETEGFYGCFGCGTPDEGPAICIDPAPVMKQVEETSERYCNTDFEVVGNSES
jgi:hypothetical protein